MDQALAIAVGQRARRLRTEAGNSLRKQAELAGVSSSALSALENGRGGMSIAALQRVGAYFDLSITELLSGPNDGDASRDETEAIEVYRPGRGTENAVERGTGAVYQLLGRGRNHDLQPYIVTFAPGAGYDIDAISHPGEEFVYVVFGEVELLYGDRSEFLKHGESARFRTETAHAYRNPSQTMPAVITGAATPPW